LIHAPSGDACPACGSRQVRPLFRATDRLYRTTSKEFNIVECSGCKLIRMHPWPDPAELHAYYPQTYWFTAEADAAGQLEETYRRFVLRDHVHFVVGALKSLRGTGSDPGPVLDVGCGGGLFPRLLTERGYRALGIDYSSQAARVAWSRNRVPVACGELPAAPFAPRTFAAITMFHVLEHLYDPASYLNAAHHLLRPGGKLIVQVPNAASWQFLMFGENWNGLDVPRHLVDFRVRDLDRLLEGSGFELVRHKHFSLRDNPAGLATSIAPGLDPMARRVRRASQQGDGESAGARLFKDLVYLALVIAAVPATALEAACRAGSTIMIEARKKS
jgi:SAM-dependent methyltransferase